MSGMISAHALFLMPQLHLRPCGSLKQPVKEHFRHAPTDMLYGACCGRYDGLDMPTKSAEVSYTMLQDTQNVPRNA